MLPPLLTILRTSFKQIFCTAIDLQIEASLPHRISVIFYLHKSKKKNRILRSDSLTVTFLEVEFFEDFLDSVICRMPRAMTSRALSNPLKSKAVASASAAVKHGKKWVHLLHLPKCSEFTSTDRKHQKQCIDLHVA